MKRADQKEGEPFLMNQISQSFLKIQEDLSKLYKEQVRKVLSEKFLRPLETILSISALVNEKEKRIKSSKLDCDHFKSKKENELLSGKHPDHPTVIKLSDQLNESENIVEFETQAVMNFFDRIDYHISRIMGPETAVLVGTLQHSHSCSSYLLSQLNECLPQSASTLCELSALFEEHKSSLRSLDMGGLDNLHAEFPAVLSHVHFLNIDIFSPLQKPQEYDTEESQISNNEIETVLKSGFLKKRSKLFWEERWFELTEPGVLSWYRNKSSSETSNTSGPDKEEFRNQIILSDVISITYVEPNHYITIEVDRKRYELFAESESLAAEWYQALQPWTSPLEKEKTDDSIPSAAHLCDASVNDEFGGKCLKELQPPPPLPAKPKKK